MRAPAAMCGPFCCARSLCVSYEAVHALLCGWRETDLTWKPVSEGRQLWGARPQPPGKRRIR